MAHSRKRSDTTTTPTPAGPRTGATVSRGVPLGTAKQQAQARIDDLIERARARATANVDAANSREEVASVLESFAGALDTLPRPAGGHPLAKRVGPCWTLEGAASRMTGPSGRPLRAETLRVRATKHTLVGVRAGDSDRRWYLPAWQFRTERGRLVPRQDVIDLWQMLPHDAASAWTHAAWMTSPLASLGGLSPLGWLDQHGPDDTVTAVADRVAARLSA